MDRTTPTDITAEQLSESMKVAPSSSAVSSLKALQAKVFGTTYNPTHARTGAKVLRQRLQGPSMLAYYPPTVNFRSLEKIAPGLGRLQDIREIQREKDVERKKMLGKGPPKKGKFRRICRHSMRQMKEEEATSRCLCDC